MPFFHQFHRFIYNIKATQHAKTTSKDSRSILALSFKFFLSFKDFFFLSFKEDYLICNAPSVA